MDNNNNENQIINEHKEVTNAIEKAWEMIKVLKERGDKNNE